MSTRTDTLTVNNSPMPVYIARPTGTGPYPAVVVMCHIGGVDEFTRDRCQRLASQGYVAAAPDVFHYHGWIEDRGERRASLRDATIVDDIRATLDHLVATANVDPTRLAVLGHCMGGRTALLGAGSIGNFRALVMYYGGRTKASWGEGLATPFDLIGNIKGRVIGFFGNLDQGPSPADVDDMEAELQRHALPVEFHRYDGAGHAFQDHTSSSHYHAAAAEDAWVKTLAFLGDALASEPRAG